jgi:predicted SnoaL-like aldol condensation-catalyzing enzyme
MTATPSQVADAFRTAVLAGDLETAMAVMADDVVFHSPVVHRAYVGREALAHVLAGILQVFEDFSYTGDWSAADGHVLAFRCRVGDRELNGVDMLRVVDGRVVEFTVMVRPYSAATALRDRMAALL